MQPTSRIAMPDNTKINIDDIVTAVDELNSKISRLRKEIEEFKDENQIRLIAACVRSR